MSRSAFRGRYWMTLQTWAACRRSYFVKTYWMISSRRSESKSTSMSGSSSRSVEMNRSKGSP